MNALGAFGYVTLFDTLKGAGADVLAELFGCPNFGGEVNAAVILAASLIGVDFFRESGNVAHRSFKLRFFSTGEEGGRCCVGLVPLLIEVNRCFAHLCFSFQLEYERQPTPRLGGRSLACVRSSGGRFPAACGIRQMYVEQKSFIQSRRTSCHVWRRI